MNKQESGNSIYSLQVRIHKVRLQRCLCSISTENHCVVEIFHAKDATAISRDFSKKW